MADATYYMSINDPREFRKELLSSSKSVIQLLQRYDTIREIRGEKMKLTHQFSRIMEEIQMLSGKLRKVLPQVKANSTPKIAVPEGKILPQQRIRPFEGPEERLLW